MEAYSGVYNYKQWVARNLWRRPDGAATRDSLQFLLIILHTSVDNTRSNERHENAFPQNGAGKRGGNHAGEERESSSSNG